MSHLAGGHGEGALNICSLCKGYDEPGAGAAPAASAGIGRVLMPGSLCADGPITEAKAITWMHSLGAPSSVPGCGLERHRRAALSEARDSAWPLG